MQQEQNSRCSMHKQLTAWSIAMEFFIAHRAKDGNLQILPSFHFPTLEDARNKIVELRRIVEADLQVIETVDCRNVAAPLYSAA